MKTLSIETGLLESITDITDDVLAYVEEQKIDKGMLVVQTPDNTCSIISLSTEYENADSDLLKHLNHLFPVQDGWDYNGPQMNSIRSAIIGTSKNFLIEGGKPVLGAFERIFLIDFKGPSEGRLVVMDAFGEPMGDKEAKLPDAIAAYNEEKIRIRREADEEEAKIIQELLKEREERIAREKALEAEMEKASEDKEDAPEEN